MFSPDDPHHTTFGKAFGHLVKRRRGIEGLTQQQLAAKAFGNEDAKSRISEIENGKVQNPSARTVDRIATALDISDYDLENIRAPVVSHSLSDELNVSLGVLEKFAQQFSLETENDDTDNLIPYLRDKAKDYHSLRQEIAAIGSSDPTFNRVLLKLNELVEHGELEQARHHLQPLKDKLLQSASYYIIKTSEVLLLEASIHLLSGNTKAALDAILQAVQSLMSTNVSLAIRTANSSAQKLYDYSRRFGGDGFDCAIATLSVVNKQSVACSHDERMSALNWTGLARWQKGMRARGAPGIDELENAADEFTSIVKISIRQEYWNSRAEAFHNRGNCFTYLGYRTKGKRREEYLRKAVEDYRNSLSIYESRDEAEGIIRNLKNMAIAFSEMMDTPQNGEENNFKTAVDCARRAVDLCLGSSVSDDLKSMSLNNLGHALHQFAVYGPADDKIAALDEAIVHYEKDKEIVTADGDPVGWALSEENIGEALEEKAKLVAKDQDAILNQAEQRYLSALLTLERGGMPFNADKCLKSIRRVRKQRTNLIRAK
ncbi:helix-turn-helix domain-containing protein [Phaeobacter sp. B1627]|uniref:helix-turn-helix domain-containing protein n=1 Tax=Phaeobacter sp. B1627 TaxID=2583809 RepID=UPI00159EC6EA|nr:helix-turn-helix transcriptional regulator [Phaeobacter sp. B1627]